GYHSLKLALSARMPALGMTDAEDYVRRLRELAGEHELRSLLPLVTVGHTEFFRDARQFRALERSILPRVLREARLENRKVRIWSAGCATGEEPYSLAIVLNELGAGPEEVELWGTDLNLAAIESAQVGKYTMRRLAAMSADRLRRHFDFAGDGYQVKLALKKYVQFEGLNLAAPIFPRVAPDTFDLVLCRNVIIYFDLPTIRALMDRLLSALRPGGLLLLGYSESLFQVYDRFEMVEIEGAFVYRRALDGGALPPRMPAPAPRSLQAPAARARAPVAPAALAPLRPLPAVTAADARGAAAAAAAPRVERREPSPPPPAPGRRTPPERLAALGKRITRGEFDAAVQETVALLEDEPGNLDALLTLGNLRSLLGEHQEARSAFAQALQREPLCVEARIFGGMAALQESKLEDARAELQKALFLEPTLSVGHYLLAQVQEKLGDREGARRSYRNAVAQLRFPQRPMAGHYPDMPDSPDALARAARYALAALEEG
ncbi:MAG TPA: CheR family methyltransferase, partial [Myxococcales bacterium]|nr:CheR family methyltransferase [Myxococcales bacterium]